MVSSYVDKGIAYQIRAMRDRQDLSQGSLADMVGMNQNAISRLESPWYGKATIRTLKRLAEAFDVGLVIRFVPFSQLVNWISGTPYWESGLSPQAMAVPSFTQEASTGAYNPLFLTTAELGTPAVTIASASTAVSGLEIAAMLYGQKVSVTIFSAPPPSKLSVPVVPSQKHSLGANPKMPWPSYEVRKIERSIYDGHRGNTTLPSPA
jgi:transcriptional regulator with XRE-family HTH domain